MAAVAVMKRTPPKNGPQPLVPTLLDPYQAVIEARLSAFFPRPRRRSAVPRLSVSSVTNSLATIP